MLLSIFFESNIYICVPLSCQFDFLLQYSIEYLVLRPPPPLSERVSWLKERGDQRRDRSRERQRYHDDLFQSMQTQSHAEVVARRERFKDFDRGKRDQNDNRIEAPCYSHYRFEPTSRDIAAVSAKEIDKEGGFYHKRYFLTYDDFDVNFSVRYLLACDMEDQYNSILVQRFQIDLCFSWMMQSKNYSFISSVKLDVASATNCQTHIIAKKLAAGILLHQWLVSKQRISNSCQRTAD